MRNFAVGFVIGAGVGAGGCYIYLKRQSPDASSAETIWPAADPARQKAASEFGVPHTEAVRVYDGYVAAYDYRTRNPKWVIEHITPKSTEGDGDRKKSVFFEDQDVDAAFRASLEDYRGSGYDRGHMAPAADHKKSQKEMDETFSLSNISPQVGEGFNRDYWARFESFVRGLTRKVDDVYVVTGPLWMPKPDVDGKWIMQHDLIGKPPGLVSVPTHYFKVVVADGRGKPGDQQVGIGAFVMPNAPIDPRIPLAAFSVPLEPLEQLAGMRFFPGYINQSRRSAVDSAAQVWRHHGMQQLKPFERITLAQGLAALPAPASIADAATALPAPATEPASNSNAVVLPKTKGAAGAIHLCELNACKLPSQDFWKSNGSSNNSSNGNGAGGGSGSRKAPGIRGRR